MDDESFEFLVDKWNVNDLKQFKSNTFIVCWNLDTWPKRASTPICLPTISNAFKCKDFNWNVSVEKNGEIYKNL